MAATLAPDTLRDADATDGILAGDIAAAGRLWVRYWPTALTSAREFVVPPEVPGLAAEALIGTIAAIAVGNGPRDRVEAFVTEAVRELGEDDEPPAAGTGLSYPEVFTSTTMTRAFAGLPVETREILLPSDDDAPATWSLGLHNHALTELQRDYLALHAGLSESAACRRAHDTFAGLVQNPSPPALAPEIWVHLSECAVCTEAFHELVFSNVALDALVDRSLVPPPPIAVPAVPEAGPEAGPEARPEAGPESVPVAEAVAPVDETAVTAIVVPPVLAQSAGTHAAEASAPVAVLRGRRGRIVGGIAAAVSAVVVLAVIVVVMSGQTGSDTPAAASPRQTQNTGLASGSPSSAPSATLPTPSVSKTPTVKAIVEPPRTASPTPTAAVTPASVPTPRAKPTRTPSSPTSAPTSSSPKPTPTPTPTPTKPPCNGLQHLLGFC